MSRSWFSCLVLRCIVNWIKRHPQFVTIGAQRNEKGCCEMVFFPQRIWLHSATPSASAWNGFKSEEMEITGPGVEDFL